MNIDEVKDTFIRFYFDEMDLSDFERLIHSEKAVENLVGKDEFWELINTDFSSKDGVYVAKKILGEAYERATHETVFHGRARSVAKGILAGLVSLDAGCRILAALSVDGSEFVPSVFVAYSDEFDRLPPNVAMDAYKERVLNDVKTMLAGLRNRS